MSCSRKQRSASGEARNRQALYHKSSTLPLSLCAPHKPEMIHCIYQRVTDYNKKNVFSSLKIIFVLVVSTVCQSTGYVHEVLVNCLVNFAKEKSVVR